MSKGTLYAAVTGELFTQTPALGIQMFVLGTKQVGQSNFPWCFPAFWWRIPKARGFMIKFRLCLPLLCCSTEELPATFKWQSHQATLKWSSRNAAKLVSVKKKDWKDFLYQSQGEKLWDSIVIWINYPTINQFLLGNSSFLSTVFNKWNYRLINCHHLADCFQWMGQ